MWEYNNGAKEYTGDEFPVQGFFDAKRVPNIPMDPEIIAEHPSAYPDGAIWPMELQPEDCFIRKESIRTVGWDKYPQCAEGGLFDSRV